MRVFPEEPRYTEMNEHALPLGIVLVTLLALVLRLYGLANQSLWIDELITLEQGRAVGYPLWRQFLDDYHNPLPMVVISSLSRLGGGEALLRLPGALLGALSVPLLFSLGRRFFGARVGLLAAFLLAVNPFHLYHSQELRGYAWMLFFGLAASLVATEDRRSFNWSQALALLLLGVATTWSNLQGLFWMGSLGLACLLAGFVHRHDLHRWGLAFGGILLITSPWWMGTFATHEHERLVPGETVGVPMRGETTFNAWAMPYAGFVLVAGNTLGPTPRELSAAAASGSSGMELVAREHWGVIVGVFGLALVLLVAGIRALGRRSLFLLLWVLLPVLFAVLLAWRNVKPFNPRYVIAVLPAFLMMMAAGLDALPRRASLALLVAWLSFQGLGLYRYHFMPEYGREDVRQAVQVVVSREGREDFVLVPTVELVFRWYYSGHNPVQGYWGDQMTSPQLVRDQLAQMHPDRRYVWYLRCRPWHDDPQNWLMDALYEAGEEKAHFQLPGVELYLFDRGGAD